MRTFTFKLKALLRLKETKREQALIKFAHSIKEVQRLEENLLSAQNQVDSVLCILHDRQQGAFRSDQIEALQSSLDLERENLSRIQHLLSEAKEIQNSRRKIFMDHDSQYKAVDRLQEKQKEEHYIKENKKEQLELEDVVGSRFLFQRINGQV
ncbi:MAG: flagellar export protein FliJ [Opitutae bacterium]